MTPITVSLGSESTPMEFVSGSLAIPTALSFNILRWPRSIKPCVQMGSGDSS